MKFRKNTSPHSPFPFHAAGTLLAGGAVKPARASRAAAARGAATGKKAELSGAASQTPRHFVDASVTSHLKTFFPTYETSDAVIGVNGLVSSLIVV